MKINTFVLYKKKKKEMKKKIHRVLSLHRFPNERSHSDHERFGRDDILSDVNNARWRNYIGHVININVMI